MILDDDRERSAGVGMTVDRDGQSSAPGTAPRPRWP